MPSLGELECQIDKADTGDPFEEYGTVYGDGVVETYIAIPSSPQNFSLRLRSKGYISEGLAALVFMDGEYQCNRNRLNLKPTKKGLPRSATEINFRMRQKEKPVGDGSFIGREWRFDTHNQIPDLPQGAHSGHFDNLGTIEVLVLRCSSDDSRSNSSSGLDVDPLSHSEIDDSASEFEDAPQEQHKHSSYTTPAAAEEDDGGPMLGGFSGLFDGANDRPDQQPDQTNYEGHGNQGYDPYQQGSNMYNESRYWRPQPGPHPAYHPSYQHPAYPPPGHHSTYPPPGFPPQARPPPTGPGKHVHFDMGGPPNTRAGPLPHVRIPPAGVHASDHSAGQQSGYPMHTQSVPYDAMPPFPGPRMSGYGGGSGAAWEGHGYMSYPMHPEYNYGYGGAPGYSYLHPGLYQGQGYGYGQGHVQGRGGPLYCPAANQYGNTNRNTGDPAKDLYNEQQKWHENSNNTGGDGASASKDSGETISDDDWDKAGGKNPSTNGDSDKQAGNDTSGNGWDTDTSNEKVNGGDNNSSWADDTNNDTSNDANNESSSQLQDGGIIETSNPTDTSWEHQDNKDQDNKDQDNNKSWSDTNDQPQTQTHSQPDAWGLNQEPTPSMPGSFPSNSSQPRALYGPHGAYYLPSAPPAALIPPVSEEEPRYDVPQSHITATSSTHQIVPGQGYIYSHRLHTPVYLDPISRPYARFVFKYRNASQLASEIGVSVDGMNPSEEEMAELAARSKEDIIAMLLRAKAALGGKIPGVGEDEEEKEKKVEPVVVPAPVRRLPEYKIPMRGASRPRASVQKLVGLGMSNLGSRNANANANANNSWVAGADTNGSGNNHNTSGASGWDSTDKGNAGDRPESSAGGSPQNNNTEGPQSWGDAPQSGGGEPSGGASGW